MSRDWMAFDEQMNEEGTRSSYHAENKVHWDGLLSINYFNSNLV